MEEFSLEDNSIDTLWRVFVSKYRYELIAGFSFLALLGGIVASMVVFKNQSPEKISIQKPSSEVVVNIKIDVGGAVKTPGIYDLPKGSRISDVLAAAGGLLENADTEWVSEFINLAEVVSDGEKLFIPTRADPVEQFDSQSNPTSASLDSQPVSAKININKATIEQLISLPGIGESYANKIIQNRPYKSIEELLNVSGIGPKKFESLKDLVSVY
ncbi:competence protein CelA [candidate division WWE3 bacterium CG_4_9_14_3_um_filter_41_6]|uniref:Competence protein CelA n=1 Tax=candidate division WWE3 bacterium CG_4_10_14_0_2_um_filter_41_14 TaxID=1975072 RepID=A0A2M7TI17_UNCKA|nr:MAG: competence protein CelA [candidate division WWE3 bacterium CG_4_10_14_0_2_um_filter_41_14]PJA38781.1 MAG: competence protein CelA [candidate division WWE3 bacterium CG_4_9_14_3_um_filter_41_6]